MSDEEQGRDEDLGARIERARDAQRPPPRSDIAKKYNSLTLAWRMTLELVVGTAIGGAIGLGLDHITGLAPLFLIVFGLLGFAAGVNVVIQTANEASKAAREDDAGRDRG